MSVKVFNLRHGPMPNAVYIGRPNKFGNPFVIGKDGTREEVIKKYREWFYSQPKLQEQAVEELRGKNLGCWCAPLPCHGDILLEYVNNAISF